MVIPHRQGAIFADELQHGSGYFGEMKLNRVGYSMGAGWQWWPTGVVGYLRFLGEWLRCSRRGVEEEYLHDGGSS